MFIFLLNYCESKLGPSFGEALGIHKEPLFGAHKCTTPNVDADGHESKFVENIVKQVVQEVNHTPLDVGDTHVKDIELLLRNDFDETSHGWHWWNRKNKFGIKVSTT